MNWIRKHLQRRKYKFYSSRNLWRCARGRFFSFLLRFPRCRLFRYSLSIISVWREFVIVEKSVALCAGEILFIDFKVSPLPIISIFIFDLINWREFVIVAKSVVLNTRETLFIVFKVSLLPIVSIFIVA